MHDPAELYLPDGQSIAVDLDDLRSQLPEQLVAELASSYASWRCAAILWSRTYNSHARRAFFLAASRKGSGFAIHRGDLRSIPVAR